jgi:hypothetical protein
LAGTRLEILETIANSSRILEGGEGELMAIHEIEKDKFLVAVYRELNLGWIYNYSIFNS